MAKRLAFVFLQGEGNLIVVVENLLVSLSHFVSVDKGAITAGVVQENVTSRAGVLLQWNMRTSGRHSHHEAFS